MNTKAENAEKEAIILTMTEAGHSRAEIAKKLGVTPGALSNWFKRRGLIGSTKTKRYLAQKLYRQGKTIHQIADELNWSTAAVRLYIKPDRQKEINLFGKTFRQWGESHFYVARDAQIVQIYRGTDGFELKINDAPKRMGGNGLWITNNESVHWIVWSTWNEAPKQGEWIYHVDGNTLNNHLDNLKVGSPKDVIAEAIGRGNHIAAIRNNLKKAAFQTTKV